MADRAPAAAPDSFLRHLRHLHAYAARYGWSTSELADPQQIILKREDGDGRFVQLRASRVTGGQYHVEVAQGLRGPKRGVNALNLEGQVAHFTGHRLLVWDGARSFASNEIFEVLRGYAHANPKAASRPAAQLHEGGDVRRDRSFRPGGQF
ncbi:hypothetical protein [Ramlibacter sp. AN1133]|uniref:hypothetical protein n=1 Tax=Ramlibacter sp. AN1133 TaxID=3133429 RepID=UPI0030BAFB5B